MSKKTNNTSAISVASYIGALKKFYGHPKPLLWYRGHSNHVWPLLPGYQRLNNPPPESVLINRFKQNANLLIDLQPKSDFDWLFIMQHYGVPTRLLDWTESPLVALYFAINDHLKKDGAVWCLDPVKLNQSTKAKPEDYTFVPSFEDERVAQYDTKSVENSPELGIEPLAVMATRNNSRIQAQLGVFTISHRSKKKLENVNDGSHLYKIVIPASAKKTIAEELDILAFGKFQLFPELSSIGEIIKGAIR